MATDEGNCSTILFVINSGLSPDSVRTAVENIRTKKGGNVVLEHVERLAIASHGDNSFDLVVSGVEVVPCYRHTSEELEEFARVLKPSGKLMLAEPVAKDGHVVEGLRPSSKLLSSLKLSGLVNCSAGVGRGVGEGEAEALLRALKANGVACQASALQNVQLLEVSAEKPSYDVGARTQLSFASSIVQNDVKPVNESVASVWTLTTTDALDDDIDIVDPDSLLTEEDFLKPDPNSLKSDCGTSVNGKRKACKNCSCGLADELNGSNVPKKTTTSACGNCSLGDAFRCSSCPYLGMPAFKSGEQVKLSSRQLNADK
nr:anamorsin [Halisarca dujardinii]